MRYVLILLMLFGCESEEQKSTRIANEHSYSEKVVRENLFEMDLDGGVHCWVFNGYRERSVSCYRVNN